MSAVLRVGVRVTTDDGASGLIVGRIDRNFVELDYDVPQPRVAIAGHDYLATCVCIHVALLKPEDALF